MVEIFFVIIDIEFGNGYRKSSLFGIIFIFLIGGSGLMMNCYFISFLIDEILLDLQDNIFYFLIFGRLSIIGLRAERIGPSFWVGTKKA